MSMYPAMEVNLIDSMGSDLTVVNAARVSFNNNTNVMREKDIKLIDYLARHKHWSPFSHCFVQFRVKAPIFVARQLAKHQVGLAWNEVSRRYVDTDVEFYYPEEWRGRAANNKQGSEGEVAQRDFVDEEFVMANVYAHGAYQNLLKWGVAPEQARIVLPQHTMTEWYWSGSLYAFARVCNQRLEPNAQRETGDVAAWIDTYCSELFPVSWEALAENLEGANDNEQS